jgi:arylsulfatase A-like enzyme
MQHRHGWIHVALALALGCGGERPEAAISTRLVDLFPESEVTGTPPPDAEPRAPVAWSFTEKAPSDSGPPWDARTGVAGLSHGGSLSGRSTTAMPILHVARDADPADNDPLYAVEVRMRASAGANLMVTFSGDPEPPLERLEGEMDIFSWGRSPLRPGEEVVTYSMTSASFLIGSGIRHVFLRPTDAADADFAIESVKLVFRSERLAGIESGVSWQGLGEVYRETLVSRAPETIRFDRLTLPAEGWLDLAVGTVVGEPLTFRATLETSGEKTVVLERTVTAPDVWQPAAVDLARWGGREAALELALESGSAGTIGLWGSPAIRRRGPPTTNVELPELSGKAIEPPQGVILIMMDTLRADHLDAWGYQRETAPMLRAMADGGVRFADSVSQGTWTKVASPTLLTSLYPSAHMVASFYDRLPASAHTLAEVFRDAGYSTLSLSSVLFTGKFTNLHQGFEELHEHTSLPEFPSKDGIKTTRPYLDRLLPWLERHRSSPFFVYFHATDPHDPFEPRDPFSTRWTDASAGRELLADQARVAKLIEHPLMRAFMMPSRAELEAAGVDPALYVERELGWYDGSILGFDVELKRLLERLRELGLERRTLIAFVADHGEEFLEHGAHFHGQSVYGELTQVPMLLYWPGTLPEGVVVEETVETIDLMPTLLALVGLAAPERIQGHTLVPLIAARGDAAAAARAGWRQMPAVAEKANTEGKPGGDPAAAELEAYAIVSDGWRLIHNVANRGERPEFELFDHAEDPLNLSNVAADHADVVERLAKELEAWKRATLAGRLQASGEADAALSSEEMERLRALGYL